MEFKITGGKQTGAVKCCIYGPEGVGKTTLAARLPRPLFIDTEGGSKFLDVRRLPAPSSWAMLLEEANYVLANPALCGTLVIDTLDWAETLCVQAVCAKYQKAGIEEFGYGKGYVYVKEEFARLLHLLDEVVAKGIHVATVAHAKIVKFEQPEEMGAYDMWTLKLGQKTGSQTAPLVKEWADMLLFCNYKILSVAAADGRKYKAQGGARVMYTCHTPCWDAKNRQGLAAELPLDYAAIAHCFEPVEHAEAEPTAAVVETAAPEPEREPEAASVALPKHLQDLQELLTAFQVSEGEIRQAVADKGYYPLDTPLERYDPQFVEGVLIEAWNQVFQLIEQQRAEKGANQ